MIGRTGIFRSGALMMVLCTAPLTAMTSCATAREAVAVNLSARTVATVAPGERIRVTMATLPAARRPYCLGLASVIDRASLPLNLGRVTRLPNGSGRVVATVPARLIPAEPAGPFLLFVGVCTTVVPDRPFVAHATIRVQP